MNIIIFFFGKDLFFYKFCSALSLKDAIAQSYLNEVALLKPYNLLAPDEEYQVGPCLGFSNIQDSEEK